MRSNRFRFRPAQLLYTAALRLECCETPIPAALPQAVIHCIFGVAGIVFPNQKGQYDLTKSFLIQQNLIGIDFFLYFLGQEVFVFYIDAESAVYTHPLICQPRDQKKGQNIPAQIVNQQSKAC
ncbi:hypothetical protein BH18ACI3_BH18ACI3_10880 [soil metagenome]